MLNKRFSFSLYSQGWRFIKEFGFFLALPLFSPFPHNRNALGFSLILDTQQFDLLFPIWQFQWWIGNQNDGKDLRGKIKTIIGKMLFLPTQPLLRKFPSSVCLNFSRCNLNLVLILASIKLGEFPVVFLRLKYLDLFVFLFACGLGSTVTVR